MEDTKNLQITLNPGIEMNENWHKILFFLPGNKDLNTYGKIKDQNILFLNLL